LRGRTRRPKTDRRDARWLVLLLAKEMLPQAWLLLEEMQELCDKTRLRLALADDRSPSRSRPRPASATARPDGPPRG
jgi:hypothetical protein